jgi:hypothetical protein
MTCKEYVLETWLRFSPEDFENLLQDGSLSVNIILRWLNGEYSLNGNWLKDNSYSGDKDQRLEDIVNLNTLYKVG